MTGSQIIGVTGNSVNTFNYTNVGVTLTVTPNISPDGFVRMVVAPKITQLTTDTVSVSPGLNAPIINQRTATTSVSVQSGQSILIGGLIGTPTNSPAKACPSLGQIPLLGPLFRSTVKTSTRTELLILLTPQVLINGEAIATTNSALSVTREQLDRSSIKDDYQIGLLPPPNPRTPLPRVQHQRPGRCSLRREIEGQAAEKPVMDIAAMDATKTPLRPVSRIDRGPSLFGGLAALLVVPLLLASSDASRPAGGKAGA